MNDDLESIKINNDPWRAYFNDTTGEILCVNQGEHKEFSNFPYMELESEIGSKFISGHYNFFDYRVLYSKGKFSLQKIDQKQLSVNLPLIDQAFMTIPFKNKNSEYELMVEIDPSLGKIRLSINYLKFDYLDWTKQNEIYVMSEHKQKIFISHYNDPYSLIEVVEYDLQELFNNTVLTLDLSNPITTDYSVYTYPIFRHVIACEEKIDVSLPPDMKVLEFIDTLENADNLEFTEPNISDAIIYFIFDRSENYLIIYINSVYRQLLKKFLDENPDVLELTVDYVFKDRFDEFAEYFKIPLTKLIDDGRQIYYFDNIENMELHTNVNKKYVTFIDNTQLFDNIKIEELDDFVVDDKKIQWQWINGLLPVFFSHSNKISFFFNKDSFDRNFAFKKKYLKIWLSSVDGNIIDDCFDLSIEAGLGHGRIDLYIDHSDFSLVCDYDFELNSEQSSGLNYVRVN